MKQMTNKGKSSMTPKRRSSNKVAVKKNARPMGPMTVDHAQWDEFFDRLFGAGGCNGHHGRPYDSNSTTSTSDSTDAFVSSRRILTEMGLTLNEVEESIEYFQHNGGFCDCEVVLNVDRFSSEVPVGEAQDEPPDGAAVRIDPMEVGPIKDGSSNHGNGTGSQEPVGAFNPILIARVEAAIQEQPEFAALRAKLLERGGTEIVPPCAWNDDLRQYVIAPDPDLLALIDHGCLMPGRVVCRSRDMQPNRCHENIARLWLQKRKRDALIGIATGYCLGGDLWRQHSWGIRKDSLLETLGERERYFGIRLEGIDADVFAFKALAREQTNWPLFSIELGAATLERRPSTHKFKQLGPIDSSSTIA